jgi:hypothetical protein
MAVSNGHLSYEQRSLSNPAEQQQDDEDHDDETNAAARVIAPTAAIWPAGKPTTPSELLRQVTRQCCAMARWLDPNPPRNRRALPPFEWITLGQPR